MANAATKTISFPLTELKSPNPSNLPATTRTTLPSLIEKLKSIIPGFEEIAIFERATDPVLAVKIQGEWFELSRWE